MGKIHLGGLVLYLAMSSKVIIFNRLGSMYLSAFYLKLLPKVLFQVKQAQKQLRLGNSKSIITWLMLDDPLRCILIVKKITFTFFLLDPPLHHNYNRDTMNCILYLDSLGKVKVHKKKCSKINGLLLLAPQLLVLFIIVSAF